MKPRRSRTRTRKSTAKYVLPKDATIDFKSLSILQKFLTDRGKILSRRVTGVSGRQQKSLAASIKRARYLGLISVGGTKKR